MTIPLVVQGTVEFAGKVFQVDSPRGLTWLESITSFRYEPTGDDKPYTVRKESGKGGDYWYGYRKMAGRLHKKYIGKSSEISIVKLEEIAGALNTPPQPRVTDKVTNRVTDKVTTDRLTALELQMQVLQESLEALRGELPGKSAEGYYPELPNPDTEVTDTKLHIELCNLKVENETLRTDYAKLLESSTAVANKLRDEVRQLRSQLATERADREEIEVQLSELKQNSVPAAELSEQVALDAATILSQLRTRRKKSKADLADLEAILEILGS